MLAGVISLLLAATGEGALQPAVFSYAQAPLHVQVRTSSVHGTMKHTLVTFQSDGRTLTAEIMAPISAAAPGPGVLFVHWLGDPSTTNHTEFDPDAHVLAARGATCVLLDAMWSNVTTNGREWFSGVRSPETDYARSIQQVVDLRRTLDLLVAQPQVDPNRIAYVAHDFGAMYGAVLAGIDPRPKYYVFMAGVPSLTEWYLLGKKPADVDAYTRQMAPLEPLLYLSRSTAQGVMFQFAAHDRYVSASQANQFFAAAPLPRSMYVYDANHGLAIPSAVGDRLAWLEQRLF